MNGEKQLPTKSCVDPNLSVAKKTIIAHMLFNHIKFAVEKIGQKI